MSWLNKLMKPELVNFKPYRSARSEYSGINQIQLDANESAVAPYGQGCLGLNRYPEPQPMKLQLKLAELYGVNVDQVLMTRGTDEGIDLLIRAFCVAYKDSITITPPTFGYYQIAAEINNAKVIKIPLLKDFDPNWNELQDIPSTKIIFLCNPNNPTGNLLHLDQIRKTCENYEGRALIVVDEAYIEFAQSTSATSLLSQCKNLVVLRTLSKAYGLAGLRIGAVIANSDIISLLLKIIPPYPIPSPCSEIALSCLSPIGLAFTNKSIAKIIQQREYLKENLRRSAKIKNVYESKANFLLLIANNAQDLYQELKAKGIIVRLRSNEIPDAIRITVGTPEENKLLLCALDLIPPETSLIRKASKLRKTQETEIGCEVILDNQAIATINTGVNFFDHMLEQLARHSGISLDIQAVGDIDVDAHHTVEDVAIVLGATLKEALGDKRGINRYGFILPMDEAEAKVSLDLSGRGYCRFDAKFNSPQVGDLPTEMVSHFFKSLSDNLGAAIHIVATGENTHHMVESIFKCFAKSLGQAIKGSGDQLPSTKGVL